MGATFGHRWTSGYGDDPRGVAGRVWATELAGLTRAQIDDGLAACRRGSDEWPPTLPRFKAQCLGIPSFDVVKADIGRRSLGFTRLVWQFLDSWAFSRGDDREATRILRAVYDHALERRMFGDEFPEAPAGAITHAKPTLVPAAPEVARQHIDAIRSELSMGEGSDDAAAE